MTKWTSPAGNGYTITAEVTTRSQNVSNNETVLNWSLKLTNPFNHFFHARAYGNIKVGGSTKWSINGSNVNSGGVNQTITLASGTHTVKHNASGNASVSVSASFRTDAGYSWSVPTLTISGKSFSPPRIDQLPNKPGSAPSVSQNKSNLNFTATSATAGANGGTILEYSIERRSVNPSTGSYDGWTASKADNNRRISFKAGRSSVNYQFRSRARTARGWGPYSNTTTIKALNQVPNKPGSAPTASQNQSTRVVTVTSSIAGIEGGSVTGYQIRRRNQSGGSYGGWTTVTADNNRRMTFTPSHFYTNYQYQSRAKSDVGWGPWSDTRTLRTMASGPSILTGGNWKNTIAYVKVDGEWKICIVYVKHNGVWKIAGG